MKKVWLNTWFLIPAVLFFILCMVLAILVPYGQEILFFNEFRHEPLNSFFQVMTHGGEIWAYIVFGIAALFWQPRYALMIALTGLLSLPLMYLLKDSIGVDRPITYFEKQAAVTDLVLVPDTRLNRGQTSFPSGHTMAAFALYSLLSAMLERKYAVAGIFFASLAILTGISRIFLVQHFLLDVMAGAGIGLLLSGTVWWMTLRYFPK